MKSVAEPHSATPQRPQVLQHLFASFQIFRRFPVLIPTALLMLIGELNFSGINNVVIPAYLQGLPDAVTGANSRMWIIGVMASTFLCSETLFRVPSGWISDRYGRTHVITSAVLLSAPGFLLAALAPDYRWLFPLRVWDGITAAAIFISIYAIIGDAVPERYRANAMGVINAMYMLGLLIGYGLAGAIDAITQHPRNFFVFSALIAAVAGVFSFCYFRKRPDSNDPHPHVHLEEAEKATVPLSRHFVLLAITFAQNLALMTIAPYMYLFAVKDTQQGLGLSLGELGLLVGAPLLGVAAFAIPLSRLADRIGKVTAVRLAFTAVAGTLWIFSVTKELWLLSLSATVVGVAFSMGVPAWLAILSSLACCKTRGTTLGGYGAMQGLAAVVGPLVGSYVCTRFGLPQIFDASAFFVAIAALLTWIAIPVRRDLQEWC